MPPEIEIKLRIKDHKAFLDVLKRLAAHTLGTTAGRVHEENVIFDTPQGGLAKHGQLLRIRTESSEPGRKNKPRKVARTVLTFKRPASDAGGAQDRAHNSPHHKVREEIEVEVADAGILTNIFEGLGMSGWFRYEKYRTTYQLPARLAWAKGLLVELDETPIGTFVELEGPPEAIDRAAHELGYSRRDYVLKNYLALYIEECRRKGQEPRDMLFDSSSPSSAKKNSK